MPPIHTAGGLLDVQDPSLDSLPFFGNDALSDFSPEGQKQKLLR